MISGHILVLFKNSHFVTMVRSCHEPQLDTKKCGEILPKIPTPIVSVTVGDKKRSPTQGTWHENKPWKSNWTIFWMICRGKDYCFSKGLLSTKSSWEMSFLWSWLDFQWHVFKKTTFFSGEFLVIEASLLWRKVSFFGMVEVIDDLQLRDHPLLSQGYKGWAPRRWL